MQLGSDLRFIRPVNHLGAARLVNLLLGLIQKAATDRDSTDLLFVVHSPLLATALRR